MSQARTNVRRRRQAANGLLLVSIAIAATVLIYIFAFPPVGNCSDEPYAGKPQYARTNPKTMRESCEDAIRQAERMTK